MTAASADTILISLEHPQVWRAEHDRALFLLFLTVDAGTPAGGASVLAPLLQMADRDS